MEKEYDKLLDSDTFGIIPGYIGITAFWNLKKKKLQHHVT